MITEPRPSRVHALTAIPAVLAVAALTACASNASADAPTDHPGHAHAEEAEVAAPRIVASYDGGVLVLEGDSLELVDEFPIDGFLRINPAGDGRRVLVSTDDAFRVLDTGVRVDAHGDHDHYYATAPALTELAFPAAHPGHVITNAGRTALFADGTGEVQLYEGDALRNAEELDDVDPVVHESAAAHHGVAVPLSGERLLATIGDDTSRSGAAVFDVDGAELARTEECPGVHGTAIAAGDAVALGCGDGAIVWNGEAFAKAASPDPGASIGSLSGSGRSPVVLGDYRIDPDAEETTLVSLVDTATAAIRVVDLGTGYSFRSLARGPHGEGLVLGTDGAIHVLDPATGEVVERIDVLAPWTAPLDWQEPRPAIEVHGDRAYVTEPGASTLHLVDLATGEVTVSAELPQVPNELATVG